MEVFQKAIDTVFSLSQIAKSSGEVPIAAVVIKGDEIIAKAENRIIRDHNPGAHAEALAIQMACKKIGHERLYDCDLIVNLEPCTMCTGMAILARLRKIYYFTNEPKTPAARKILASKGYNHYPQLILLKEYQSAAQKELQFFFQEHRKAHVNRTDNLKENQ